jgi:hypothetical protein
MQRFNHFLYGFVPGLLLPIAFLWIYLNRFYPDDIGFWEILRNIFPGVLLAKLLLLSAMPNMVFAFVFYKSDSFKIATGLISGGMPYIIASFFML